MHSEILQALPRLAGVNAKGLLSLWLGEEALLLAEGLGSELSCLHGEGRGE